MPPEPTAPSSLNAGDDNAGLEPIPPLAAASNAIAASDEQLGANAESHEI